MYWNLIAVGGFLLQMVSFAREVHLMLGFSVLPYRPQIEGQLLEWARLNLQILVLCPFSVGFR